MGVSDGCPWGIWGQMDEEVAGEEWFGDGMPEGWQDAITDACGVEGEVGLVAVALEIGVGPLLGLGVCMCDAPG